MKIIVAASMPLLVAVVLGSQGTAGGEKPPATPPVAAGTSAQPEGDGAPATRANGAPGAPADGVSSFRPDGGLPPPRADADMVARADALVERHDLAAADTLLGADDETAALVVRARALRGLGDPASAAVLLEQASPADTVVAPYVAVEKALIALERGQSTAALELLAPLLAAGDVATTPAVEPLARALATFEPALLLEHHGELERLRRRDDPDSRSRLLGWQADALRKLGRATEAQAVDKQRWLEEPVSLATPAAPPAGVPLTNAERLGRVELLQTQNRNERVVEALDALPPRDLTPPQRCQRALALGLALRKLRSYERSEAELGLAVAACKSDGDRERRARYLQAKVVSIRDGLRSIPLMEAFVKRYPAHSMADDVLFWAGDVFQRRDAAKAEAYYRRVEALPGKDDYCLEARWRLAWMAYRRGDLAAARDRLLVMLGPGCSATSADRARGHYWLARIAQAQGNVAEATDLFRQTVADDVVGFHAQLAVTHLAELAPPLAKGLAITPPAPGPLARPASCAAAIDGEPGIGRAEALLARGLRTDTARVLLAIAPPAAEVISSTHASAIGVTARYASKGQATADPRCDRELRLYLALLLDRAGAYKDAAWRLRTEFAQELSGAPTPATAALWRAAYPLAWRDEIAAGERESKLPELLLQALSREESAFDAQVVSWAGAYGLTQLLLSTGRDAGRLLTPRVTLARAEELLDPALNARLGGAFLASLLARFDGSTALALAGYNAGADAAAAWWKRFGSDGVDLLGEEIPIQETRGYVKRVLRTYGVYRWLYKGETPALSLAVTPAATARR